jgi:hypothetical protein
MYRGQIPISSDISLRPLSKALERVEQLIPDSLTFQPLEKFPSVNMGYEVLEPKVRPRTLEIKELCLLKNHLF